MALKESEDQATAGGGGSDDGGGEGSGHGGGGGGGGGGHSKEGTQESYLLEYDFGSDSFELVKVRMKREKETAYDIRQNTHFSLYFILHFLLFLQINTFLYIKTE